MIELLVEQQPLHQAVPARVIGPELAQHTERERVRLDRVVIPEPGAFLGRPESALVPRGHGGVHHALPDGAGVLGTARALERERQIALDQG